MKLFWICTVVAVWALAARCADFDGWDGYFHVQNRVQNQSGIFSQLLYDGTLNWFMNENHQITKKLTFEMTYDGVQELSFRIYDSGVESFQLPYREPFPFNKHSWAGPTDQLPYYVEYAEEGEVFYIRIHRKDTGAVIFDSTGFYLKFASFYREISTKCNGERIYGMGERRMKFLYTSGSYTLFNKDQFAQMECKNPGCELYGHHPMWLQKGDKDKYHVGFIRNTNGMRFEYAQNQQMVFKIGGGVVEFKFFIGDNPEEPIQAYHHYINGFSIPPFWSMGLHFCKWGFHTSDDWKAVWQAANDHNFPFDTLWTDIDYMYLYQDFGIDTGRYNVQDMKHVTDLATKEGVNWIPILDPGISIPSPSGQTGVQSNVFIKSAVYAGQNLMGCVWPGEVHYVDFNHPRAQAYWTQGILNLTLPPYNAPMPAGIWLDMNEFSNFVYGEYPLGTKCPDFSAAAGRPDPADSAVRHNLRQSRLLLQTRDDVYQNIWTPTNQQYRQKTLSMSATHYNGDDAVYLRMRTDDLVEFDIHNMNGFFEGIATNRALQSSGKALPFIIARSTMFGSGKFTGHWTGDNAATWDFLYYSISEIFNFQLFGIPMTGVDICGFSGESWAELCARWMQLGAFYPFARNHNINNARDQWPWSYPDQPYVMESSMASIRLRYSLLKFYYHQFVKAGGVGTIFKPLFFEYPHDALLDNNDFEFMVGRELLFAPVYYAGEQACQCTWIKVYIPNDVYYDFYTGGLMNVGDTWTSVPFSGTIPMYIRGGHIVHQQDASLLTRARELGNHFKLLIALDRNLRSIGTIMSISNYDDEQLVVNDCVNNNCILNIEARGEYYSSTMQLTVEFIKSQSSTIFSQQGFYVDELEVYSTNFPHKKIVGVPSPWCITAETQRTFFVV